jgi:Ribonuclease G/E
MISINFESYSTYRQAERDAELFSLQTICRIDRTISRTHEDKSSSMLIINSTFLVSFEINSNGNIRTQEFEEWSVPVLLQPDVVGEHASIKSSVLFNF